MHRIRNVIDRKASKNEKENFKKKVTELKVVILGDDTCIWGGCCSKRVHVYNREMEQDLKMEAHSSSQALLHQNALQNSPTPQPKLLPRNRHGPHLQLPRRSKSQTKPSRPPKTILRQRSLQSQTHNLQRSPRGHDHLPQSKRQQRR